MKTKLSLILIIILIVLCFLNTSVKATQDIYFKYQDKDYTIPFLESENYNSTTDLVYLVYSRKSDFKSFGIVVLKNAKTYFNQGYIIKIDLNAPFYYGYYAFVAYKENENSNTSFERLQFYYFRYISDTKKWGAWGGLLKGTDALTPANSDFIYAEQDLYNTDNNILFPKAPLNSLVVFSLEGAEEIPVVIIRVVQRIIPISLILLLIPLVIYLVRLLIYQL